MKKRDEEKTKKANTTQKLTSTSVGNNSGNVGYSQAALKALNEGTYSKINTRKVTKRTSEEQVYKAPKIENKVNTQTTVPTLKGIDTTRARKNYEKRIGHVTNDVEQRNLSNRGYSSSRKKIDFSGLSGLEEETLNAASKQRQEQRKADEKRRSYKAGSPAAKVSNWIQSLSKPNEKDEIASRQYYIDRYGASKDEVIDAYEQFKEARERSKRETKPFIEGLKDFPSALERGVTTAAGTLAKVAFPNSDLEKMLNSDTALAKSKEVEKKRDYTRNSSKLSESKKNALETYYQLGDFLTGSLEGGVLSGGGAIVNPETGSVISFEPSKILPKLVKGATAYGNTATNEYNQLKRRGVDDEKALQMANLSGLGSAALESIATGSKVAKTAGETFLKGVLKSGAKAGLTGAGIQTGRELAEKVILENQSSFDTSVNNYIKQGLSEKEAGQKAAQDLLVRIGGAGLSGLALGAASSAISKAIPSLTSKISGNTTDDLNSVWATQNALPQNERPLLTGTTDNTQAVTGLTYNEVPALVDNIYPIQMPGTNGVINLPGQTETINLPDLAAKSASTRTANLKANVNPQTVAKLTAQIETNNNSITKLSNEKAVLEGDKTNYYRGKLKKAVQKRIDGIDKEIKSLEESNVSLNREAEGKPVPVEEKLTKQQKNALFGKYDSVYADLYVAKKIAGGTEQATQLEKAARSSLKKFVKNGSMDDLKEFMNNAAELQLLAEMSNGKYITKSGEYSYNDWYGTGVDKYGDEYNKKLLDSILERNAFEPVRKLHEANGVYTNVPEPVAESAQTPSYAAEKVQQNPKLTAYPEQIAEPIVGLPEHNVEAEKQAILASIQNYEDGTMLPSEHIYMGKTPDYVSDFGDTSLDIGLRQKKYADITSPKNDAKHQHGLTSEQVADFAYDKNSPIAVFRANDNTPVIVGDRTVYNAPVVSALDMDSVNVRKGIDKNLLRTIYGKNNVATQLQKARDTNNILFEQKEKVDKIISDQGLQSPPPNNPINLSDTNIMPESSNVNNQDNSTGYWLRLLGDENFLQQEASYNNISSDDLRSIAAANLGYSDIPPSNNVPHVEGSMPGDKKKTSQYYKNTMRHTEENVGMSDAEYQSRFNEDEYGYTPHTDVSNEQEARNFINRVGGNDAAVKEILNGQFDNDKNPFTSVHVDAVHILANEAEKAAKELEAQGLDATQKWYEANRLHKKLRAENTRSAQVLQSNQKWIKRTPQGAVDDLIMNTNKAIDRTKTKGYTADVDNLADSVEDAILNNEGQDRINAIKDAFARNKTGQHKTKKYEQQVLDLVGGQDAGQKSASSLAEEAAKLIKKNMGVSTLSMKEERAILNLLEEASHYEEGSRSYRECVAQAMKIYDATLPSSVGEKVKSIWYDNMLFSLKTMMTRNFGGNLGANAIENIATPLQVGADWLVGKVTGERSRTLSKEALTEGTKGMGKGFKDWYLDVKQGVNTTRSGQGTMKDALNAAHTSFKPNSDNKALDWINKAGSKYDRVVRKGMEVGDRPIYEAKYAATKAELQAVVDKFGEDGIRKGLPEGDYSVDDVIELIAVNDALEAVLQNNTHMKEAMQSAKKFLKETSESMLGMDVSSMIMPFIEVSGNMADRYFQFTPFGIVGNIARSFYEKKKYGSVNQRRFTGELGRNVLGGLISGGLMAAAANKLISDPYSEDADEKKRQQLSDYQEYALQNPDQSWQIDITDIPILGPKLRESKMEYDALKEGGIPQLLSTLPAAVGSATLDSLFQGLNKVTGGNNKYGKSGGDNYIGNAWEALKSLPSSVFLPALMRQTAQFTDPYKRDLGDYNTNEYYKNLVKNGIPILRETLDPKINTAGENVKQFGNETGLERFIDTYVMPWKVTHPNENITEVQRYADMLKEKTNGEYNPQLPVFNAGDLKKIKGYDEENYTHDDLVKFDKDFYSSNNELGDFLINDSWYKSLPYDKQARYLDTLFSNNKQVLKENFVHEGMTDEEKAKAGDDLYEAKDRLAKILRDDDGSHKEVMEYFKNIDGIENLEDKYGYKMNYDTYVKWQTDPEKKKLGGAEKYAASKSKADELNMQVENYLKKEKEYPGGAAKYAEDKKKADKLGLSVKTYQNKEAEKAGGAEQYAEAKKTADDLGIKASTYEKLGSKAGRNADKLYNAIPALNNAGLNQSSAYYTYADILGRGSNMSPTEYINTFKQLDVLKNNNYVEQNELTNYFNNNNYSQQQANQMWELWRDPRWKKVPVLVNGQFKAK